MVASRYDGTSRAALDAWALEDWGAWRATAGDTLITHDEVYTSLAPLSFPGEYSFRFLK